MTEENLVKTDAKVSTDIPEIDLQKPQSLLSVCREFLSQAPLEPKLANALEYIRAGLDKPEQARLWLELDKRTYGDPPDADPEGAFGREIKVQNEFRGRLCLLYPDGTAATPSERKLLIGAADFIALGVAMAETKAALRKAKSSSEIRAANLQKEMWLRTEALASKTGYFEGILRSSDDAIVTTDLESHIVEFNPGAEQLLGYSAEEVHGRHVGELWESAEEREKILQIVKQSGGIRNYETRLRTKSGDVKEVSITLSLLKEAEGGVLGTVGITKDISQQNAVIRRLEQLNQNFRETLHFINHEYKNSLMVIGGFVRRLLETETDPKRKEQLEIVFHHSKFLEAMSLDFLVFAELEHGEFQIRPRLIEDFYEEVIRPAMVGLKERYPDSFESYDVSMGGVGHLQVMGDANLLEIVYRNLFGNALKYRRPNGKISYGVEIYLDKYMFNVWNEGPGVAADQRDKIFEKFYRTEDETTRQKRGTGLGLYNIKGIIEAHGGRIWCESRPGHWINFLFELPRR